jgi:uncharacterized membrane protein YphA (DoxX/SURF4 family)
MWLANLHWKVPGKFGEDTGGGLYKYIAAGAENAPLAPFRWALDSIVLPNFAAFGWFTLLSETAVAALLLVGYRTRLVALVGAALTIPIGLSVIYYPKADEWSWAYLLMFGIHVLLWAAAGNEGMSVDTALRAGRGGAALRNAGIVTAVIGVLGLWVARSVDFAGRSVALLGSDAGFTNADGTLVRRAELKFLFFNPLWALLTAVAGVLLIAAARRAVLAYAGGGLLAAMAVVAQVQGTYIYARDDGAMQKISTGTNVALWAGLALWAILIARRGIAERAATDE